MKIAVCYLIWLPYGQSPVDRFEASWRAHPHGLETGDVGVELHYVYARDGGLIRMSGGATTLDPVSVWYSPKTTDLESYLWFAQNCTDATHVMFLNTNSEVMVDEWLSHLAYAVQEDGVGMVGCTGSWESLSKYNRYFEGRPLDFPTFPNPHLRTNAFLIGRDLFLSLDHPTVRHKTDLWLTESGPNSWTRQILRRGLDVRVMNKRGDEFGPTKYDQAYVFRQETPEEVLVSLSEDTNKYPPNRWSRFLIADNQTRHFDALTPEEKKVWSDLTWRAW